MSNQMMKFEPISNDKFWAGTNWVVTDEEKLATMIAKVALGQARHVERILNEIETGSSVLVSSTVEGAKRLLTAADSDESWHRDGWMFQVIAWIAAHLQDSDTLKTTPHMIHADKGFDGVHLRLDGDGNVEMVIICEQKATGRPRQKITSEVWPDFRKLEKGKRDNELIAEVTTLLERYNSLNADKTISKIFWENVRSYNVAVTVGEKEHSETGRNALFKDYEDVVGHSDVKFRRAETFFKVPLRVWMADIAQKAITSIERLEAEGV